MACPVWGRSIDLERVAMSEKSVRYKHNRLQWIATILAAPGIRFKAKSFRI